jgi:hypothetical protein
MHNRMHSIEVICTPVTCLGLKLDLALKEEHRLRAYVCSLGRGNEENNAARLVFAWLKVATAAGSCEQRISYLSERLSPFKG